VGDDGRWLVPVQRGWASPDDGEAGAYLLASNQLTTAGGWDQTGLDSHLDTLRSMDVDLSGLGFDSDSLIHVDAHDRTPAEPRAKAEVQHRVEPGEVWQLGPHRLACGSCTDRVMIAALMAGVSAPDLLITDPPYSSGGWQEAGRASGSIGTTSLDEATGRPPQIANDRLSTRGYQALMSEMLNACPTPAIYMFTDWRMWVSLFDVAESSGFGVRSMIVWDKGSPGMGRGWRSQHELVLHAAKQPIAFDNHAAQGNVLSFPRTGNPLHPTQKPVELLQVIIRNTPGAVIYDPFAGSGTTLIAADLEGRTCYATELDPGFCDVILDRWEQHGGAAPFRVDATTLTG
jgi:DNA modification methylase